MVIVVRTSSGEFCFNGVTRANVLALCRRHDIPLGVGNFAPEDVYAAAEAFVTGTFGGITPVREIDGRQLAGAALPGPMTQRLRVLYEALKDSQAAAQG
jgi:branched-chain amino acid aminotransferase